MSTHRYGIRSNEKREALEALLRTLYQNKKREICFWIEQDQNLAFFPLRI